MVGEKAQRNGDVSPPETWSILDKQDAPPGWSSLDELDAYIDGADTCGGISECITVRDRDRADGIAGFVVYGMVLYAEIVRERKRTHRAVSFDLHVDIQQIYVRPSYRRRKFGLALCFGLSERLKNIVEHGLKLALKPKMPSFCALEIHNGYPHTRIRCPATTCSDVSDRYILRRRTMAKEMSRSAVSNNRPLEPFEGILETALPGFFSPLLARQQAQPNIAHIDIVDHDDAFILKAEMAGVAKDKLDIQVHGNQVYISGTKEDESVRENEQYIYRERRYGEFSRTVQLPADVNGDLTKAKYKDGVLELVLPKTESAKRKKITVL